MTRLVLYVAAPLRPTVATAEALNANLARAMRWLSWLRRSFPEVTFIAPWIAAVLAGEDDSDQAQREAGLVDADAIVPRCDGIVLVGGRVSSGMARERGHARRVWDLTWTASGEPPEARSGGGWLEWAAAFESSVLCPEHGDGCPGPDCCCADLHQKRGQRAGAESSAPTAKPQQDASSSRNAAAAVGPPPKPCARRIGSTWCTLDHGHAGEHSGPPGREISATEYGPGRRG